MNIVISGGTGFIGHHLLEYFRKTDDHKINVLIQPNEEVNFDENKRISFHRTDFTLKELEQLLKDSDQVIHLAGRRMPRSGDYVPFRYFEEVNIGLLENILLAGVANKVKKVIFASTIAVYGNPSDPENIPENYALIPVNNYGLSKLVGENIIRQFTRKYKIPAVSLRFAQVFGPGERRELIMGNFMHKCKMNETIEISPSGLESRDYLYVKDLVSAIDSILQNNDLHEVYNIGSGSAYSALEIATIIKQHVNSRSEIIVPEIKHSPKKEYMDISRIKKDVGWEPQWSLETAIEDMLKHMK